MSNQTNKQTDRQSTTKLAGDLAMNAVTALIKSRNETASKTRWSSGAEQYETN